MKTVSRSQTMAIRSLMQDERWNAITDLLSIYSQKINTEDIVGNTEFETLRMLHVNQGKIKGLTEFFDMLEQGAFNTD